MNEIAKALIREQNNLNMLMLVKGDEKISRASSDKIERQQGVVNGLVMALEIVNEHNYQKK